MKTGTTTIQEFLSNRRKTLEKRGYIYPSSVGHPRHVLFTLANSHVSEILSNFQKRHGFTNIADLEERQRELKAKFEEEVTLYPSSDVIVSCEEISLELKTVERIDKMRQWLSQFFDEIVIIIYFRNQIEKLISGYSTHLRFGGERQNPFDLSHAEIEQQNFFSIFQTWASIFGKNNINARVYDERYLTNGDAVTDFLDQVNMMDLSEKQNPRRNRALDVGALSALYAYNCDPDLAARVGMQRRALVSALEKAELGPPLVVDPDYIENFYKTYFEQENAKLSSRLGYDFDVFYPDMRTHQERYEKYGVTTVSYSRGREVLEKNFWKPD